MNNRPTVRGVGRTKSLSAGHDAPAARPWSLITGAERHGVCPQRHLTSVLAKLPCTPLGELEQF
jgi:hypothetical protein